jgi:hypothetical protein
LHKVRSTRKGFPVQYQNTSKQPKSYDQAVALLVDLRDLAVRDKDGAFGIRLEARREAQAKKPSFIQRLAKAGL